MYNTLCDFEKIECVIIYLKVYVAKCIYYKLQILYCIEGNSKEKRGSKICLYFNGNSLHNTYNINFKQL